MMGISIFGMLALLGTILSCMTYDSTSFWWWALAVYTYTSWAITALLIGSKIYDVIEARRKKIEEKAERIRKIQEKIRETWGWEEKQEQIEKINADERTTFTAHCESTDEWFRGTAKNLIEFVKEQSRNNNNDKPGERQDSTDNRHRKGKK